MEIKIRRARKEDIPCIAKHWVSLMKSHAPRDEKMYQLKPDYVERYEKFLKKRMRARNAAVFVAELKGKSKLKGKLIGHAMVSVGKLPPIYLIDREGYVDEIFVKPEYRGKGVGTSLLATVEDWCRRKRLRYLGLTVHVKNREAFAAYRNFGLREHRFKMSKSIKL